jgi:AbrB family looped-hinge helix DNA binding protein
MTTLTSKGQVTIPKAVRDLLGLKPGAEVTFELESDGRVVVRANSPARAKTAFARLRGTAKGSLTTDQIMALTRGNGVK